MHAIRHLVAIDNLPTGGVADDDDHLEVRKNALARDLAEDLQDLGLDEDAVALLLGWMTGELSFAKTQRPAAGRPQL